MTSSPTGRPVPPAHDPSAVRYRQRRIAHWDGVARARRRGLGGYYHRRLEHVHGLLIPPGRRILELGCGQGDLLARLRPSVGVGVDFSAAMLRRAGRRHPELVFVRGDAHELPCRAEFDVVILSDLVNDLWDVQRVLEQVRTVCAPHTRVVINSYSRLWELPLALAGFLRLARPTLYQNWLTPEDLDNLLGLAGFDTVRTSREIIMPLPVPILAGFANRYLAKLWPIKHLALANFLVARPSGLQRMNGPPRVSVIVAARNEAGNIRRIFDRTPEMGSGTELVFVEGHSQDDTFATIQAEIAAHPERRCQAYQQPGRGKGDAVRLGFEKATGDILMILDADMTVPPEDLPRFVNALCEGRGEFINGVRLVYPMEDEAMRFANLVGNKAFSLTFSWLLDQTIKDTLCGTKVLWRADYDQIAANRAYFGDFDPFGDFDLLFGAAKLNLEIVDLPVRYRARTYGSTNIQRWKHGWILLKMVAFASRRLKFV